MSLVEYGSSDEDEQIQQPSPLQQPSSSSLHSQSSQNISPSLPPPFQKLPDASLLLSSPTLSRPVGIHHSARVAAAMADNASRKREANASTSSSIRAKIPKTHLPHSKNIPETTSGLLTPPQLRGRSNVVTEDITKLFVQRNRKDKSYQIRLIEPGLFESDWLCQICSVTLTADDGTLEGILRAKRKDTRAF